MAHEDEPTVTRPKAVANGIAFQKRSAEAFNGQRLRERADLKCQLPDGLWPDDVKQARSGATVGGIVIPARPMLSIPKLDQPVQIQMNQMRAAQLGVKIHPLSQQANVETAEIKQGLYRSIEVDSRADQGRLWGADRALKCGTGWYRVNVVYDDTTDDPFDQTIRIQRILRQSSCFPDPFAQEPDFSDAKEFLYVSYVSLAAFKAQYPQSKICSFEGDELKAYQDDAPFWFEGESDALSVCVAEYFYTEYETRQWVILDDGSFAFADEIPEGRTQHPTSGQTRTVKEPIIKWAKITACDVLEEQTWNGKYIPFIPCIGRELQTFDGERRWFGIYSTNKDSAHLFNVAVSNAVEVSALEPKAPWIGAVGQFKTNNRQWQLANSRNLPYLEYDPVTVAGNLAPPPQRNLGGANLGPSLALIDVADSNLQAGTAMYEPTLGRGSNDDPAKKVLALQDQGLASNSHWLANLAEITLPYEAKVTLDLMTKVYDRPGRVAYVTGEDGEQQEVILNQAFTRDDSDRPVPVPGWEPGMPVPEGAKFYDLTTGKYGCVVSVGKRYETRARAGADAFSQLLMAQPELIKFVGDIWMGFQDFPGHELAAKRLKAAMPPEIANADKEDQEQPDPQALQQELKMAEQGAQMMKQIIEEQGKAIEAETVKQQAEMARAQGETAAKVEIEKVKAQLAIRLQQMKDETALELERLKQAHANLDREDEQRHSLALASAEAAQAERAAEAQHAHALESGATSHEQALESQAVAQADGDDGA